MTAVDLRKAAQFWTAIADATTADLSETYQSAFTGQPSSWFQKASALLGDVHPDLSFVVEVRPGDTGQGSADASGRRTTLEVTGGGIRRAIPAVLGVVDAAPADVTERFHVHAFRARAVDSTGLSVRVGSTALSADTVRWISIPTPGRPDVCHLTVFVPGWLEALGDESPYNEQRLQAVFLLLDHVVGEFAVMTQLGELRLREAASAPAAAQPLSALGDHLDRISAA